MSVMVMGWHSMGRAGSVPWEAVAGMDPLPGGTEEPWGCGTWGHGDSGGLGSAGQCWTRWALGLPSSEDSGHRTGLGVLGVLSLSGPFGFCSQLQLHSRLPWPWKDLLAGILGVGSGARPCAIAS